MTRSRAIIIGTSALVATLAVVAIRSGVLPAGIAGEWVWLRQRFSLIGIDLACAVFAVLGFAVFAAIGMRALDGSPGIRREIVWVSALFVTSVTAQVTVQSGGPIGQGLTKWTTLGFHGASGYFGIARKDAADPWQFWADYPSWIRNQDVLHIGTHPPGLFLVSRGLLKITADSPAVTAALSNMLPYSAEQGIRTILELEGWSKPERAAIILMGLLTLLACSATVIPLYLLARTSLPPAVAWAVAAMWPIAPSVLMFQPTADTAFPFLATSALALAAGGGRRRAVLAGLLLAIGMQFSLVFLPVGLSVALVLAMRRHRSVTDRVKLVLATGLGFLAVTLSLWWISKANPFAIWWTNQQNHGRFYRDNPRSYLAWVFVNPIELAFAVGFPTMILALVAFFRRKAPIAALAGVFVILLMNFSGKNLSEVARLWLPLMPPIFLAAGSELSSDKDESWTLGAILVVLGIQTLALQATLQVVSPT